nr:DUF2536 family protein [Paenibacillus xylanexedens]
MKQVQHQGTYHPILNKMLYSAVVHFAVD